MIRKVSACLLLGSLFAMTPGFVVPARAQATEAVPPKFSMDQRVALDLKDVDLYDAFKILFKQVKIDFTIDNALKGTLITAKINQPFRVALESIIKASGLPITYTYEDEVMRIIPIDGKPFPAPKPLVRKQGDIQEFLRTPVNLEMSNIEMETALKMLFKQGDIPYSFAAQDVAGTVNTKIKATGREALETLLKAAKTPLTYRIENNILTIEKKQLEDQTADPASEKRQTPLNIRMNYESAKSIAAGLKKLSAFRDVEFLPDAEDQNLMILNLSERDEYTIRRAIHSLDVEAIPIIVKAELIVEVNGDSKKRTQTVFAITGTTFSGKELTLDIDIKGDSIVTVTGNGKVVVSKGMKLHQGTCRLTVTPRLSGSETFSSTKIVDLVNLATDGTIQLELTADGYDSPLRFSRQFNGADRVWAGSTNTLLSSTVKLESEKNPLDAQVRLLLTATRKFPAAEKPLLPTPEKPQPPK